MTMFLVRVKKFFGEEDAPTAIEYGVMAALIAAVVIVGATAMGVSTNAVFNAIAAVITPIDPPAP